jgi:hypothetical protein
VGRLVAGFVMAIASLGELRVQHGGDEQEGDQKTHDLTLRRYRRRVKAEDLTQTLFVNR